MSGRGERELTTLIPADNREGPTATGNSRRVTKLDSSEDRNKTA